MRSIVVKPALTSADVAAWLRVPHLIFAGDPAWVAPIDRFERRRLLRTDNPFFGHAEAGLFVAYAGDRPVGRVSAHVDRDCVARHGPTGHFGFFDVIDDDGVGQALLDAAGDWLRAKGMERIAGPYNFSINEECGVLVDGFVTAPAFMMPHSAPWYARVLERAGFAAAMDLFAFRVDPSALPPIVRWMAASALQNPSVSIRCFDTANFSRELALMVELFNDAWRDNWGFVPFSLDEMLHAFGPFKPFFRDHYGKFVCFDGRPVGFAIGVPNVNEIIAPFRGRLWPFNALKLAWALRFERFRSGRLPLLGLRKEFQGTLFGSNMFAALIQISVEDVRPYKLDWIELSWVLGSNKPLITFLRSAIGEPAKVYRLYGRNLHA